MLDDVLEPTTAPPPFPRTAYVSVEPGLWRKPTPPGPWLQFNDAAGFEWNQYLLAIPQLPATLEGFRIVQLSDLHCRARWQRAYDQLIARLTADPPDLLLFTGDLIEDPTHPHLALPTATRLVSQLRARLGVFGIFGNHDRTLDPAALAGTPLQWIDGRRVLVNPAAPVELIALPGPLRESLPPGFASTQPPKTPGVPRIVLSHFPDHIKRLAALHADVFLAGHTHGGQMCLPNGIPLLRHDSLPRRLTTGLHRLADTWLVVNRGLGFSSFACRTFCPAEVIEIRLTRG